MASNNHQPPRPTLQMSYSQSSMGSTTNGMAFSQSHMGSFNTSQSVASTPRATPPPKASQQSAMSFAYNGLPRGSFTTFEDMHGYGTVYEEFKPQIYKAVYSNVAVYEMEVNGVAVMKRRADSWLNATQILKVAGVVKARRTKTLEKEIAAGEHEKVQGGYGKYQGTWVNYQRGVELCREYHVDELLRPLLEYDMGPNGTTGNAQDSLDTPTKEQAMAAQRKRLYNHMDNRGMSQPQQGTFFQNISRTAATAVNAMSKARFDSPAGRGVDGRKSSVMRKPSQQMSSQDTQIPFNSQQSMYSVASDSAFASNVQSNGRYTVPVGSGFDPEESHEPPRKRIRSASNHAQSFALSFEQSALSFNKPTPTEPNDSFYQDMDGSNSMADGAKRGLEPLQPATTPERFQKMKLIMTLFLDKRTKDFSTHPALMQLSGEDLEIPLDEYRNNALHWAAMLARMSLVSALVAKGVNIFRLNGAGETALQKSVGTRNNLDYRSFPRLLQILAPTIEMVDYSGRTVLHHIAVMAATGGGGHVSAKHYLEALLEFIVRHGGTSSSHSGPPGVVDSTQNPPQTGEVITLGRFISEIVNLRDDQGDTALNLAGRARSVLVPQLLEVGADPHIPNHTGLRPADYGVGVDMVEGNGQSQQAGSRNDSFMDQLAKTKKEILDSTLAQITSLVHETLGGLDRDLASNLTKKQEKFDHWHAKIRESAKARQIEQKHLDDLKSRASERIELSRRCKNLEKSSEDLLLKLKETKGGSFEMSTKYLVGDADKEFGLDIAAFEAVFPENFDPASGFTEQQAAFLGSFPPAESIQQRIEGYHKFNDDIMEEVERLRSKNVVLGQNYRRVVMACTDWTAEQVDEAVEGLTQCVKDLNDNPVPEDEAIEILMKDRGQDW
ncbi:putative APSES transcription factor (MbpA) [Aspergillus saccharolyticus JOP 1030-1]|uniref:Cell pattern formation-associated protein stuA n=1 Tax=Aspergillus saccharolyticus JOP 1030-1 TaxID=1450539 RepID=A0A318ZXM4_9EURO|nr:apses transcription factor [Aspergillus saccharolyticus JOP 1030-1]PYH48900.1 apses transcription factor [Aspergillus saccharolyticus JOP 1030-1]